MNPTAFQPLPAGHFDILGLGAVAVDDLVYVDSYPPPDSKRYVTRVERQCGGLTATALVAASRLGARCAYAGALGDDPLSHFCIERLEAEGVSLAPLCRRSEARPFHSFIIVGTESGTRNIFADATDVVGAAPEWPPAETLKSTKVLLVDHVGVQGALRAARLARFARIPVVADLERDSGPGFEALFELVDHLIVSRDFATARTGSSSVAAAVAGLWNEHRQTVVVTDGGKGAWYRDRDGTGGAHHQPAFPVQVVDSTGCGDVFHGAYATGLAAGMNVELRMRFAAVAAALKARRPGGQAGAPTLREVDAALAGWEKTDPGAP